MSAITRAPPAGAAIEVFSRSQSAWMKGKIESVKGQEATVVYTPPGVDASKVMKKVVDWPDAEQVRYPAGAAPAGPGGGPLERMMASGTAAPAPAPAAPAPAPAPAAPAPAPKAVDAGGAGVPLTTQIGGSVEVYCASMARWVPAVVLSKSSSNKLVISYTVEESLPCRSTSLRPLGAGDAPASPAASSSPSSTPTAGSGGGDAQHKLGATGPREVIDRLPALDKGIRYHQVRKHAGFGRKGAGENMFLSAGRMGIHLYHMTTGEHFKTYSYEELKSWEAGPTVLLLEKRKEKSALAASSKTVEYETKPGEAMQIVEAIMRQVNNLVKSVKAAADELAIDKKHHSGSSLTKSYRVKKAGGRGRGKEMRLSCGQMGVQVLRNGEHYKTYNYKDLEEWATVSSTGSSDESTHNKLILVKRDRDGMTTEYTTDPGDATKIAHDITRKAKELAKAMRARKAGKVRRPALSPQPFASI